LSIDVYINTKVDIDTSFKLASTILVMEVAKNIFRTNIVGKNTFIFRRLEKTAIKNCKKKNAILLLSISILKHIKSSVLVTKSNCIFNITETITIESIDTILENQIFKKARFDLKKSNLVVKKQKAQ